MLVGPTYFPRYQWRRVCLKDVPNNGSQFTTLQTHFRRTSAVWGQRQTAYQRTAAHQCRASKVVKGIIILNVTAQAVGTPMLMNAYRSQFICAGISRLAGARLRAMGQ